MTDLNTEILDLKKTNLFKNFPNNKLQCLSFTSDVSSYDKGELIFFEKDFPKELYILIEGKVEKYNASKKELFQPVSLLNEDSFLAQKPHKCSAVAKTASVCIKIEYNTFVETLNTSHDCATEIIQYLANKIHDFT